MSLTPTILLIAYSAIFLIFLFLSLLNVYHILRFGSSKKLGVVVTSIYFILVLVVVIITFQLLGDVNWKENIELSLPNIISNTNAGY